MLDALLILLHGIARAEAAVALTVDSILIPQVDYEPVGWHILAREVVL